ncbi:hypothetical protein ACEPAH_8435 [Sanghuangporus vaninii]
MASNNKNRDSVADLEQELYDLLETHHASHQNANGEPAVPASALPDVIRVFGEHHDGIELLTEDELARLNDVVSANPGLEVTPNILLGFIRALAQAGASSRGEEPEVSEDRGEDDDLADNSGPSSRSSSRGPSSLPSAPAPKTPNSGRFPDSPFESARRRRTAPLTHAAPSSWNSKRVGSTTTRRRSDASNYGHGGSDSESASRPSSRMSRRPRAPSNPVSPRGSDTELWDSQSVRPGSRANSRNRYGDSISASLSGMMSPGSRPRFDYDRDDSFDRSRGVDSDSEDDDEEGDPTLGLVLARNGSMASLESQEREEALQRANQELQRKVAEQDRILQNRISEHEAELERMEIALEETKSELSLAKREEKELRAKEIKYIHQIQALESEIAKSQRALETAKASYQSLQKQYQEQCTESESLRNALRTKDQQYRDAMDKISLHSLEIDKWQQQQEQMEHTLQALETQLAMAREAQAQLEEQKQENLLLKETIDRLRFDMDELRTKADGSVPETKGTVSQQGSLSKSLGVELARLNHGKWPGGEESDEEEGTTAVSDNESDSGATEGEDVVQTIITRRKKKVASRAMKRVETIQYEDVKHYSDAYTQHEVSEFTASNCVQTDPEPKRPMAALSTQTEMTSTTTSLIQTDPEPVPKPVLKLETEVQTDALDSEHSGTFVDDSEASTSKRPNRDLPPSYAESSQSAEDQEQRDMRIASEAILRWHKGLDVPLSPLPKGISDDALEEWAALKQEIGFDCLAIDKVLEMSLKTGCSRDGTRSERSSTAAPTEVSSASSRRSRLYNIYNTFVYGKPDAERDQERDRSLAAGLTQAAVVLGGCIVAAGLLSGPYLHPQYNIPGGPTYYDRAAFSEFNNLAPVGEGFVPDGAATVWDFLGRIGGEAARMARGWPS